MEPSTADPRSETPDTPEPPRTERPARVRHPAVVRSAGVGLLLGALGVVFGDIGTSPLYAFQTVFSIDHNAVKPTPSDVYGVVSLVFWSVTLIVSIKYVLVVMRADNDGEGGVMALTALLRQVLAGKVGRTAAVIVFGVLGASLFYGDSLITPAISVLSAVEGLAVAEPGLARLVVPIALTILTLLFIAQRWGTARVGALFGPVMLVWFAALAVAGLHSIAGHVSVVQGLLPTYAVFFVIAHPYIAFIAMGAVVLSITGAEALYADMGHFGRPPIARAWFLIVFPALTLNYLGQAALIIENPADTRNPFFLLVPSWALLPMVVLATAATVIASQAVISGAFSVSRQAMTLGLLPPLRVRQTSEKAAGQVFLPAVNILLFIGVVVLVLAFRSSQRLATAYGVSVTGALLVDTILLLVLARTRWHWPPWKLALAAIAFGGVEATFLAANLTKILHGGWLPLLVALLVFTVMTTWQRGRELVAASRAKIEGSLEEFIAEVKERKVPRIPGCAVFPHPGKTTTPLALRANLEFIGVLHQNVAIVSAVAENVPHVAPKSQVSVDTLGDDGDGVVHVTVRYGFSDHPLIPPALRQVSRSNGYEIDIDPDAASYFVSRATLRGVKGPGMRSWRKAVFIGMAHNASDPAEYFGLPIDRTVVMGSVIDV